MRTTKRFTPSLLDRYRRLSRGQGVFGDYIPWHRVSRSDPASQGRSHLQQGAERQHELLSDHEWVALLFISMLPNQLDNREQYPLSLINAPHELRAYRAEIDPTPFPGTLDIAQALEIRHPKTTEKSRCDHWVMTTDFLIALREGTGPTELLAIAVKTTEDLEHQRTCQMLTIEKKYWESRNVPWLLITPTLYCQRVGINLRMQMPWMLGDSAPEADRLLARDLIKNYPRRSLTFYLQQLEELLSNMDRGQRAFWQGVLRGEIPMNLSRGWRPHQPVELLTPKQFLEQNPIASRRSAWI